MAQAINDMVSSITSSVRANTAQENKWIASAPPEMQEQMKSQIAMQKEQELIQLLAQSMKQMSELSKTVIRSIGG